MLDLRLGPTKGPLRLLCLGAHPDDIEIGAGGCVLRLAEQDPTLIVRWVVFTGNAPRAAEAKASAREFLVGARNTQVDVHGFRDGFLPYDGGAVKAEFERLKLSFDPLLILTHHLADAHQDHRLIAELTHNTFRNHLILEYEIPKHDGDLGNPPILVSLSAEQAQHKAAAICRHFRSQKDRTWFREETFLALARLRGAFTPNAGGYAEGFYCRKAVLEWPPAAIA